MLRFGPMVGWGWAVALAMTACWADAADWDVVPIPANAGPQREWVLLPISDDFRYDAPPHNKPVEFTDRWDDWFINNWTGPGRSHWSRSHSIVTGGRLGIAASVRNGTDKINTGVISSRKTFRYPLFVEARVKLNRLVLASNVWMLSGDSTQEIDIVEAYGSDRPDQQWTAQRIHLSHHVFVRKPFQDYQPTDEGSWHVGKQRWSQDFHRVGVHWIDPWNLDYYVDGEKVRSVSGPDMIDPNGFTGGTGLSKAMHIIINVEDQDWRSDEGITPTDDELADWDKRIYWVDWIRVYQSVAKPPQR
ncbi:family 16 glycosylhydrolase [Crateriforma conspicua]|uniref:Beta-agarase B n=1 Tax=Crateriforma conspicua TaxID=2527996 RepID=A0A5C5Y880_9PLAN|nr:family 16 glycosylhydrolase [Crateriforma conspicua]TWT71877.1 Beta-agarase B precursor [Crateriforma conspicua]